MSKEKKFVWRIYAVIVLLFFCLSSLAVRIIYLGTTKRAFLKEQGQARSFRVIDIPAHRGMILDRNGIPLAISTPMRAVWISPKLYRASKKQEEKLTKTLRISSSFLKKKGQEKKEFVYLKRRLSPIHADQINRLKIPGVFIQEEYQRYYPEGEVTAQLLGFTDIDDRGIEGIELAYDQLLRGVTGKKEVIKDRLGQIVSELNTVKEPQAGQDLVLSIDRNIQYLAYEKLQKAVQKYRAETGSVVILDVQTSEVLAMVNYPSYNPNIRPQKRNATFRNRAATDLFEPGSTIKVFSLYSALESGKYWPNTKVDTGSGWFYIGKNRVRDEHGTGGVLTLTEILQKSSDVGVAKVTLSLPPERLLGLLRRVGFGESTYSGFPGEAIGKLPDNLKRRPFVLATLAFGYSMSTTVLQLARAYVVLGARGIIRPITFLKVDKPFIGQRALSYKLTKDILMMMESVLTVEGTGQRAQVIGYRVAGKTGTAGVANKKGYEKDGYNSIFVGIAPSTSPRLVMAIVIKNPQHKVHYGGVIAAPVFAEVMTEALHLLDIEPDRITKEKAGSFKKR